MAPRTRFFQAHKEIDLFFQRSGLRVFTKHDLSDVLAEKSSEWHLPLKYNTRTFCQDLTDFLDFKRLIIDKFEVYTYKKAEYLDIFQKLKKSTFYSHYTALRIHDLTEQTPYHIFVSKARKNTINDEVVNQKMIDEAFLNQKVKSSHPIEYEKFKINLKTIVCDDVDIETKKMSSVEYDYFIRLTNLEKTLIDSVINPDFCGGPAEVLKAFERSREKLSAIKLKLTINRLGYKYPYHQLIGFYMERSGVSEKKLKIIEEMGVNNDFYLIHGNNEMYSSRWKLHYPNVL